MKKADNNKKNKEVRVNIRLSKDLRQRYHKYCLKNKTTISEKVRGFIEEDLKNK